MKKHSKYIKILISISILAYLFYMADMRLLWVQITSLKPYFFASAFVILLIQCGLSSLKWKIILSADDKTVPFRILLKIYLIGNFLSLFLPSSFGGDFYRIYALKEYNRDYLKNTSSVLFDRLSGLFALASISLISFAFFYKQMISYRFLAFYAVGIFLFWSFTNRIIISKLQNFDHKLMKSLCGILQSFNRYRTNKRVLLIVVLISFCFQGNIVFLNKIYCLALKIDIPMTFLFMVIPLIYLTEVLPISINGLGLREGAFVFFFTQKGISNEEALAAGILVISVRYIFAMLFGGTLFLLEMIRSRGGQKKMKSVSAG